MDQDGGRDAQDQAARAGQGPLGLRLHGRRLQSRAAAETVGVAVITGSAACRLLGCWRIAEADLWDRDYRDDGSARLVLNDEGRGEIAFGAMQAGLQLEYGRTTVFFSWEGFEEMDEVRGTGSAALLDDGSLEIEFAYHLGDEAILRAERETSSTAC